MPPKKITESVFFTLSAERAEAVSSAISDFLCWIQGFKAAGGEYSGDCETLRDFNIKVKEAIRKEKE